eukprot:3917623-Pyramimonas_sp.AAC.1
MLRASVRSSTCDPSGRTRMPHPIHAGAPLTCFVPPEGAPPTAPEGGRASRPVPISAHPSLVPSPP